MIYDTKYNTQWSEFIGIKNQIKQQINFKDNEQWAEIIWFMIQNVKHNKINSLVWKIKLKNKSTIKIMNSELKLNDLWYKI